MCIGGVVSQCWTRDINRGSYIQSWPPQPAQTYGSPDVSEEVEEWFTLIPMFAYLDNMRYFRWGEVLKPRQFPLAWRERSITSPHHLKGPKTFFIQFYHPNLVGLWYTPFYNSVDGLRCADWWGAYDISQKNRELLINWWLGRRYFNLYYLTAKYIANERRWVFHVFIVKLDLNRLFGRRTPPYEPPPSLGVEDLRLVWEQAEERIVYFYDSALRGLVGDMYVGMFRRFLTVSTNFIMLRESREDDDPIVLSLIDPRQNAFAVVYLWEDP